MEVAIACCFSGELIGRVGLAMPFYCFVLAKFIIVSIIVGFLMVYIYKKYSYNLANATIISSFVD